MKKLNTSNILLKPQYKKKPNIQTEGYLKTLLTELANIGKFNE